MNGGIVVIGSAKKKQPINKAIVTCLVPTIIIYNCYSDLPWHKHNIRRCKKAVWPQFNKECFIGFDIIVIYDSNSVTSLSSAIS